MPALSVRRGGETRYTSGTAPTTYKYTGQREESSFGLYYYGARWYDTALGRFVQADSIIPEASQGVQAWDRYAYANNNPLKFNDPSGHDVGCAGYDAGSCAGDTTIAGKLRMKNVQSYEDIEEDKLLRKLIKENSESPNPSMVVVIPIWILITAVTISADAFLLILEVNLLPLVAEAPIIGVPSEALLLFATLVLTDFDLAISSWAYRIYTNPNERQHVEMSPIKLWGFGE